QGDERTGDHRQGYTGGKRVVLEQIDEHLQQGRSEQDLDDRLVELLDELLPQRLARQRRQGVATVLLPTAGDRLARQPGVRRAGELRLDLLERSHGGFQSCWGLASGGVASRERERPE